MTTTIGADVISRERNPMSTTTPQPQSALYVPMGWLIFDREIHYERGYAACRSAARTPGHQLRRAAGWADGPALVRPPLSRELLAGVLGNSYHHCI
jgi:hypothetical protein